MSRISQDPSIHPGDVSASLRRHGVCRSADIGHQHESRAQPRAGDHLRSVGRLVDLLGRSGDRHPAPPSSPAVSSRSESRWRSSITSRAIVAGSFTPEIHEGRRAAAFGLVREEAPGLSFGGASRGTRWHWGLRESLIPTNVFDAGLDAHAWIIYKFSMLVFAITGRSSWWSAASSSTRSCASASAKGDETVEPPQVYGSEQVEIAWTVIPVLIVIVPRAHHRAHDPRDPGRAAACRRPRGHRHRAAVVVGVPLPELGIVTRERAAHPGERPRPIRRRPSCGCSSADVAHSFWVPRLAGQDRPHPEPA